MSADQQLQTAQQLYQARRLPEALSMLDAVLARRPDQVDALLTRGSVFFRMNRPGDALASIDRAVALNPQLADGFLLKGSIHGMAGQYEQSIGAYDRALALNPDLAGAWFGRGNVLAMQRRPAEALESYRKALAFIPDYADAWAACGNQLSELRRHDEALAAYDKALGLAPELANAWLGRGNLLMNLYRDDEALEHFDRAIALNGNLAEAWLGRGIVLSRQQRRDEALRSLERAGVLGMAPAKVLREAGVVLRESGRLSEAFTAFTRAAEADPTLAEAWYEIGGLEMKRKHYADALTAFDKASALSPGLLGLDGAIFRARMMVCDWRDFDAASERLLASFETGVPVMHPFAFVAAYDQPQGQLDCARLFAPPADPQPLWNGERYAHDRIRIAYLSADFHEHPVAQQIAGMLERHDRARFAVTALSIGPQDQSDMRKRLQAACERFIDVVAKTDREIAALIRELEIDILVDLTGATDGARTRILAKRCAPVQVNYLGYPGTMGADYYDYLVADRIVVPQAQRQFYSEKIVYLADSYMVTDDSRRIPDEVRFTREEQGLPADGFVYCCFNNTYKILPDVFGRWMRILAQVEGSVLWLHERAMSGAEHLRREAEAAGIDPARLVFSRRLPRVEDHLARLRLADLFLDTLPFNAHSTATDALWAGLPVLTCPGESFTSRVGASLLQAIQLPELIVDGAAAYEAMAIELATDRSRLEEIRSRLASHRQSAPLFDTERFTRQLEAAYIRMHDRQRAGSAPADIDMAGDMADPAE